MAANQPIESAEMATPDVVLEPATLARESELRRFNWLTIYVPLIVVSILAVLMLGALTWVALFSNGDGTTAGVNISSGVADTFLTLVCLVPFSLICAILPLGGVGFLYWRRQNGSLVRERTTNLIRKVGSGIDTADGKLNEVTPKIANATIQARTKLAGGFVMLDKVIEAVKNGVSNQLAQSNTRQTDTTQTDNHNES